MPHSDTLCEKIILRETIFTGRYMQLERLDVRLPDGNLCDREIVRVRDAVAVLPIDDEGNVHLVRQYRPAMDRALLEIPAGLIDDGETVEAAALRECEEELGIRPKRLEKLITYAHAVGYSTGMITLFLGSDLERTGQTQLDSTEFVEPVVIPFSDLNHRVVTGEFIDAKTIVATILSRNLIDSKT